MLPSLSHLCGHREPGRDEVVYLVEATGGSADSNKRHRRARDTFSAAALEEAL